MLDAYFVAVIVACVATVSHVVIVRWYFKLERELIETRNALQESRHNGIDAQRMIQTQRATIRRHVERIAELKLLTMNRDD